MSVHLEEQTLAQLKLLQKAVRQAGPEARKELKTRVKTEIEDPLARKIRAAANGPHGNLAAQSVTSIGGAKPAIWLGRGGGLSATVAFGSEFGGQKVKSVLVISRSKLGKQYMYRRRTTMQFRYHNGQDGYWLIPTMRRNYPETLRKTIAIVEDVFLALPGAQSTGRI